MYLGKKKLNQAQAYNPTLIRRPFNEIHFRPPEGEKLSDTIFPVSQSRPVPREPPHYEIPSIKNCARNIFSCRATFKHNRLSDTIDHPFMRRLHIFPLHIKMLIMTKMPFFHKATGGRGRWVDARALGKRFIYHISTMAIFHLRLNLGNLRGTFWDLIMFRYPRPSRNRPPSLLRS